MGSMVYRCEHLRYAVDIRSLFLILHLLLHQEICVVLANINKNCIQIESLLIYLWLLEVHV